MHCKACDKILTEKEDAATYSNGVRLELCTPCAAWLPPDVAIVGLDVVSRLDDEAPLGREEDDWGDDEKLDD